MNKINKLSENEELELYDLFHIVWFKKGIVLLSSVICVLVAFVYIQMASPLYQASVLVAAPTLADVDLVNYLYAPYPEQESTHFSRKDLTNILMSNILSKGIQYQLFKAAYLPTVGEKQQSSSAQLFDLFIKKNLLIEILSTPHNSSSLGDKYLVKMNASTPQQAKMLLQQYLTLLKESAQKEIMNLVLNRAGLAAKRLENKMTLLRETAKAERYDQITLLKEAIAIADKKEALPAIAEKSVNLASNDIVLLASRGKPALESALKILESRDSDDAFIPQLRPLENQYNLYKQIQVNSKEIVPFHLERPIQVSNVPVSPHKSLIIGMALFLGIALSSMGILLQAFIREAKHARSLH